MTNVEIEDAVIVDTLENDNEVDKGLGIDKEVRKAFKKNPELLILDKINPDEAARRIVASKKLRKLFGVHMTPYKRQEEKIGRNEPCPCGSGLKYKKCCGK